MFIGSIADDLTGATDIAGFLAGNGLDTIQIMGLPATGLRVDAEAVVVSLKSRSIPPEDAVNVSLDVLAWLKANNCGQVYFKYCSTFDSTRRGNIGPVTDALLDAVGSDFTVVCPSLPVNGRVVKDGILMVNGVPLAETGMRHHPITPMTDSNLISLMEMQARGKAGLVPLTTVEEGAKAVEARLANLRADGCRYAVLDSTTDRHLDILAAALDDMPLLTGGSGLGAARARRLAAGKGLSAAAGWQPPKGGTVVLSGSCSEMTNRQVAAYIVRAASRKMDVARCLEAPETYAAELAGWVGEHAGREWAPLVYATVGKEELAGIQQRFGAEKASAAVEAAFAALAVRLAGSGCNRFVVAGGETSGSVTLALKASAFRLGPQIAPGVPWIQSLERPLCLALKSGNFGDEQFFFKAQELVG